MKDHETVDMELLFFCAEGMHVRFREKDDTIHTGVVDFVEGRGDCDDEGFEGQSSILVTEDTGDKTGYYESEIDYIEIID